MSGWSYRFIGCAFSLSTANGIVHALGEWGHFWQYFALASLSAFAGLFFFALGAYVDSFEEEET